MPVEPDPAYRSEGMILQYPNEDREMPIGHLDHPPLAEGDKLSSKWLY
jgi:hypothetical protein